MFGFHLPTFIFVIINLLVLYSILKRILFKPVSQYMEKRSRSISEAIEDANTKRAEAEELLHKYESTIRQSEEEAGRIIAESKERAAKDYDSMISKAKNEYEAMIAKAEEEIEKQRSELYKSVRNEAASLALAAASRLLERNIDNEANRRLAESFINEEVVA